MPQATPTENQVPQDFDPKMTPAEFAIDTAAADGAEDSTTFQKPRTKDVKAVNEGVVPGVTLNAPEGLHQDIMTATGNVLGQPAPAEDILTQVADGSGLPELSLPNPGEVPVAAAPDVVMPGVGQAPAEAAAAQVAANSDHAVAA